MGELALWVALIVLTGLTCGLCWIQYTLMNRVDRLEEVLRTAAPGMEVRLEKAATKVSISEVGGWHDAADYEDAER